MKPIYLDYNASTPIAPEVAAAMATAVDAGYGNPSSGHWAALPARQRLDDARWQVADLIGCGTDEVVFTSGGSEANNFAIKGTFFARSGKPAHFIASAIEHPSVLEPLRFLERLGARVTRLPVDGSGLVNPDDLRRALTDDTALVSLMHANNEVGTIEPIADCARIARERGVPVHVDAAQSAGKIPVRVDELGADLLSIAGHKLYAPKGVGALYIRRGVAIEPLVHGGGHESGRRAGTESVALAAGLGAACALAADRAWTQRARVLRDRLHERLVKRLGPRLRLNGHPELRLPNTLNVSFAGCDGLSILAALDGFAASTGSACHSGRTELSPVLRAMGVPEDIGHGAVRFSLGRGTTVDEVEEAGERILETISRLAREG